MPPGCNEMVWPWAKGSLPVVFPSDVGFPVGDGNHWLAMQVITTVSIARYSSPFSLFILVQLPSPAGRRSR